MTDEKAAANRAFDHAIEGLARLKRQGAPDNLSIEDYLARAVSIRDYVIRMSDPDPVDPKPGPSTGNNATIECPHCHKDIVVTLSK